MPPPVKKRFVTRNLGIFFVDPGGFLSIPFLRKGVFPHKSGPSAPKSSKRTTESPGWHNLGGSRLWHESGAKFWQLENWAGKNRNLLFHGSLVRWIRFGPKITS